jgi:heme exporter protein D
MRGYRFGYQFFGYLAVAVTHAVSLVLYKTKSKRHRRIQQKSIEDRHMDIDEKPKR